MWTRCRTVFCTGAVVVQALTVSDHGDKERKAITLWMRSTQGSSLASVGRRKR